MPKLAAVNSPVELELYEVRRTIHPRAVHGWFASWRLTLVVLTQVAFYGTAWLTWNRRQAVLFDLASRKFYIFGMVLWPQDFIFLTALLIISALSLFLFTAVAGRLWCGYACPQTVYTEIFMWIERRIEGDRMARMKLDQQPAGLRKVGLKATKHATWIALALWTGFTFVGYFTPIKTLAAEVAGNALGPWETFWILFYGFATYGNAGWMREQVCKHMCPYARFQSVMFDSDTLVLDDDGVGEALFAQPFPEHDTHASHVGQDRHQSDVRKILRQVRQVERQPRAHHDGVGAAGAALPHIGRILGDRFHHVDRDSAAAVRDFERHPDFTVERDQVESVEFVLVGASFGTLEKIGVMMAQVDAGNGAERACARDGAGQPVRRDAHAHAALHDRQQRAAAQLPARQRVRRRRARIVQQASLIDATSHARGRLRG